MSFKENQKLLLEQWLEDQSFLNWAMQSNKEDTAKWELYFNVHPHLWKLAKAGRAQVIGIPFKEIPVDTAQGQKALSNLMQRLESQAIPEKPMSKTKNIHYRKPWLVAASIAVLMLVSSITYFQFFQNSEVLLTTGFGQHLETLLPDGSKLTLNANSSIKYYSNNPRKIWLKGEAFFEVKKKPETDENFLVYTPDLKVTVLGTSFNVNARNDQTKVFLEEGKVELDVDDPKIKIIKMEPGDLITYSKKQKELKEKRINASLLENVSWKDGTLIFNNTPLSKALFEIEDIYGVQFVFQSEKFKEETISGGVPIRDLKITMQILKEVYGIQISKEGKRYFISNQKD